VRFSAFAAVVAMGCAAALPPGAAVPKDELVRKAYEILLDADRFESAHIGVAGADSAYFIAFRVLIRSSEGKPAFHALLRRATPAGKVYALSGIYFADPDAFEAEARRLALSKDEVATMNGCTGGRETVGAMVFSDAKHRIEVAKGKTLDEVSLARQAHYYERDEHDPCDIAGGCIPLSLVPRDAPRGPIVRVAR